VKKFLTPEAAEKVLPVARDYVDILQDLQHWVDKKQTNYPVDTCAVHPTLDPHSARVMVKKKFEDNGRQAELRSEVWRSTYQISSILMPAPPQNPCFPNLSSHRLQSDRLGLSLWSRVIRTPSVRSSLGNSGTTPNLAARIRRSSRQKHVSKDAISGSR
jgi:hypothetical protein